MTIINNANSEGSKSNTTNKRVIITTHIESPTSLTNKTKRNPTRQRPRTSRPYGYDRRAHLLAQVREIRKQKPSMNMLNSRSRSKKREWLRVPNCVRGVFQCKAVKRGYEHIGVMEEEGWNNRKPAFERRISGFCGKLKSMLIELSCGWKCNKEH